jgi:hypothetical protein
VKKKCDWVQIDNNFHGIVLKQKNGEFCDLQFKRGQGQLKKLQERLKKQNDQN